MRIFSKEFAESMRQKREEARDRVQAHVSLMEKALVHGQHEVLGVWDLGEGARVSMEAMGDGSLRARRWTKIAGEWVGEPLAEDAAAMEALRSEPEPMEW